MKGRIRKAQGTGHRAQGSGLRGRSAGHRAQGTGEEAQSAGHRAQGKKLRAQSTGHRAQGTEQKNGTRKLRDGRRVEQNGFPPAESLPAQRVGVGSR